MNDLNDRYLTLAQWDTYVEPVLKTLKDVNLDRLKQQVTDWAGKPPRMRGLKGLQRPILSRKRRPGHMAYMRRLVRYWYVKQDAQDEPKALNLRGYAAARLLRIARALGTYQHFGSTVGGETKWVPIWELKAVQEEGSRDPATVGKVLGLLDWFQHCLAAFEGRTIAPAVKLVKITALSPLEQVLGEGFTVKQLNTLAHAVGLVNDAGQYCLGDRRKGAFAGFCRALKEGKISKAAGDLSTVVSIIALHFGVVTEVRKTDTDIAERFYTLTNRALKNATPTD